jgi:hypothetical protein
MIRAGWCPSAAGRGAAYRGGMPPANLLQPNSRWGWPDTLLDATDDTNFQDVQRSAIARRQASLLAQAVVVASIDQCNATSPRSRACLLVPGTYRSITRNRDRSGINFLRPWTGTCWCCTAGASGWVSGRQENITAICSSVVTAARGLAATCSTCCTSLAGCRSYTSTFRQRVAVSTHSPWLLCPSTFDFQAPFTSAACGHFSLHLELD